MSNEGTQLTATSTRKEIRDLISGEAFRSEVARVLPRHLTPERFTRVALTALTRTPDLAKCTQASLFKCLLDLSAAGLEPDGRRAHLIPYRNKKNGTTECTLIIDYKGLVELIRRSGEVVSLRAETVCEKDEFEWVNGEIEHRINWREPRGEVQAVYAEARMKSGEVQTATMTKDEIEAIRKRSQESMSSPWKTAWSEMAKKTTVRRLSKMLPLSFEVAQAIEEVDRPLPELRKAEPVTDAEVFSHFSGVSEPENPETKVLVPDEPRLERVVKKKRAAKKAVAKPKEPEEVVDPQPERVCLNADWLQSIEDQLLDKGQTEGAFLELCRKADPECPAKTLAELTKSEAEAGLSLLHAEAEEEGDDS